VGAGVESIDDFGSGEDEIRMGLIRLGLRLRKFGFWKVALLRCCPLCGAATEGLRREGAGVN
jgi:hypothetical protein